MVSSSYGSYGYNGYGGYGQQSGSVLGNTTMSSAYSSMGSSMNTDGANIDNIMKGINETYKGGMASEQKKSGGFLGGIKDFFKGIVNGAKNLLKSLADPKTWLMIAACAALCFIFPPAGLALLAVGVVMAGSQIVKGVSSGNMEQAGEGFFNLALCGVGARSTAGGIGKGSGAAKSSVQASEAATASVAKAEKALEAAKVSKDTAKIAEAERALALAKSEEGAAIAAQNAHVKAQAASMTKGQRTAVKEKYDPKSITEANVNNARSSLKQANDDVAAAKTNLAKQEKGTDGYKAAEANLAAAEKAAASKADEVHNMLLAKRIEAIEAKNMMGRVKHYGSTTWSGFMSSGKAIFNKNMTNPYTGEVRTLYSSTPKPAGQAAAESANKPGFFSRMNPFSSNSNTRGAGAQSTDEAAAASTAAKSESTSSSAAVTKAESGAVTTPKKEVVVPPKETVATPEVPPKGGGGQSAADSAKAADKDGNVNVVQEAKDVKSKAANAGTKAEAEKAVAAADEALKNAKTPDEIAAATQAKQQADLALKKFEQPSRFSQYGSYLWNNKVASVAQANTAGVPLLQMTGMGGGQSDSGGGLLGLGNLMG
ncbi:MAG: hypothetical protein K0Q50_2526 [Vampirovibrio sp.]|jgi:hypothetical protein|nr:hypothetical protein [Vampirovibrio sp.]